MATSKIQKAVLYAAKEPSEQQQERLLQFLEEKTETIDDATEVTTGVAISATVLTISILFPPCSLTVLLVVSYTLIICTCRRQYKYAPFCNYPLSDSPGRQADYPSRLLNEL